MEGRCAERGDTPPSPAPACPLVSPLEQVFSASMWGKLSPTFTWVVVRAAQSSCEIFPPAFRHLQRKEIPGVVTAVTGLPV